MRLWATLGLFFGFVVFSAHAQVWVNPKYPNGLLTHDFGIVTEDDLAFDSAQRIQIGPYDPATALNTLYWQCFPTKDVKADYDRWRDADPRGLSTVIQLCSLEIEVNHRGEHQEFIDHRAHPVEFCRMFKRNWNRLVQGEKYVCLNADGGYYEDDSKWGKFKIWVWQKFKTKKGCYSYFVGECNTGGCSKRKCS